MPRRGSRRTPRAVLYADRAAGGVIRVGGGLVIVAVLGICVFLIHVVIPLFGSAGATEDGRYRLPRGSRDLLFAALNEYRSLGMALYGDGTLSVFDGRSGVPAKEARLLQEGARVQCFSRAHSGGHTALGLADGTLVLARITFASRFVEDGAPGGLEGGIVETTPLGQSRVSEVQVEIDEPVVLGSGAAAPILVGYQAAEANEVLGVLKADGQLLFSQVTKKQNMLTGKVSVRLTKYAMPYQCRAEPPLHLLLNSRGDQLFLGWADGTLRRYDLRNPEHPLVAEEVDLCADGARLTSLAFTNGDQSIVAGDSSGASTAWFRLPAEDSSRYADGYRMVAAHRLEAQEAGISAVAVSGRDKTLATGTERGGIWLRHLTSSRVLARLAAPPPGPDGPAGIRCLQITPKADGLFAVTAAGEAVRWALANPHPETTPGTIFGRVWYEGYDQPVHTWQSTGGTDDFEPKFGLVPLIFGTLKSTVYALLFAVPLAILAAIYTSEFLSRRTRALVKPAIEMMASLPSVVLGFLAALVLAPWVENWVLSLLMVCIVVPSAVVFSAYAWLFLPSRWAQRLEGFPKLAITALVFLLAVWAAFPVGGWLEQAFFLGDFRAWLSPPRQGSGTAFWALALLPATLALALFVHGRWIRPRLAPAAQARSRLGDAAAQLGRGLAIFGASIAASVLGASALSALGFDPRDSVVGTYVQRNTLIVGFVMGFAVIPIIYTIAEDALSSVPEHLRGAALGCGATPWQTAVMVILPTAMSGIFSAVMVGLGRAVGETMIVVMAAGNTPIIDVNPFNGLRALSATIAVELPEAVKDGSLYRMLFLAALTLFAMTFVVNTVAEIIRLRFRKRAFEL